MTTPLDQTRAEFEAWAKTRGFKDIHLHRSVVNGQYGWDGLNVRWEAWQAAIASRAAEVGALQSELAGNEASTMHLSRMVDGLRGLLSMAESAMTRVQQGAGPVDESSGDLDARIPYARWATFIDFHVLLRKAVRDAEPPTPQDPLMAAKAAKETT